MQIQETKEVSLIERCNKSFNSRMQDIRIFNELSRIEEEAPTIYEKLKDEMGEAGDYGLSLDFVEEGTFEDQKSEYVRFQISWGGPSEEFRLYPDGSAQFWFLDWFCGEHKNLEEQEISELMDFLGAFDYEELKSRLQQ